MEKYDYLVVGAGFFGSVFAYEAKKRGKKVLVIDKRNHIGGNSYTRSIAGINVHEYGAHIFHTNDKNIWNYVNQFAVFNNYINSPIANYNGEIYNLPFNMNTFNKVWGVTTPAGAKDKIAKQVAESEIVTPSNLEEQAISMVGKDIYIKLVKGYTEKQWGRQCKDLPTFIIKRLPLRFTYNNNYFNDIYQGIPIGGYTPIFEKLLEGIEVLLEVDFFRDSKLLLKCSKKVIYTGAIDEYYQYCYGELEYRGLSFIKNVLNESNFQGNAVVNYTDETTKYTRIIEHKHFEFGQQEKTVITYEYPTSWQKGREPFYPVNNDKNNILFSKYEKLASKDKKIIFGGRLGKYKYNDMDQTIYDALSLVSKI